MITEELTNEQIMASGAPWSERYERLYRKNLPLIAKEANKFATRNPVCDVDDYIQEGALAMLKFGDNYRPSDGKFSTYLTICVRTAIKKLANKFYGPFSIDHNLRPLLYKIEAMLRKETSADDIKVLLHISDDQWKNMTFLLGISRIDSDMDFSFTELPLNIIMEEAKLSDVEVKIVGMRTDGKTLRDIAKIFNKSHEWVRAQESSALEKVKRVIE